MSLPGTRYPIPLPRTVEVGGMTAVTPHHINKTGSNHPDIKYLTRHTQIS